jgi:hypothetical protein
MRGNAISGCSRAMAPTKLRSAAMASDKNVGGPQVSRLLRADDETSRTGRISSALRPPIARLIAAQHTRNDNCVAW